VTTAIVGAAEAPTLAFRSKDHCLSVATSLFSRAQRHSLVRKWSVVVVVEAAGDDDDRVLLDVVDQPVFLGDPP